jgi:hypothetical protein
VTQNDFESFGGSSLLRHYFSDSVFKAVSQFYKDHQWHPWKFHGGAPKNYWDSKENRVLFFETISSDIGVAQLADWYQTARKEVDDRGGMLRSDLYLVGTFPDSLENRRWWLARQV